MKAITNGDAPPPPKGYGNPLCGRGKVWWKGVNLPVADKLDIGHENAQRMAKDGANQEQKGMASQKERAKEMGRVPQQVPVTGAMVAEETIIKANARQTRRVVITEGSKEEENEGKAHTKTTAKED